MKNARLLDYAVAERDAGRLPAAMDVVTTALAARKIDATALALAPAFPRLAGGPIRPCAALADLAGPTWVEVATKAPSGLASVPFGADARLGILFEPDGAGGRTSVVAPTSSGTAVVTGRWRTLGGVGVPEDVATPSDDGTAGASSIAFLATMLGVATLRNLSYGTLSALPGGDGFEDVEVAKPMATADETGPALGHCATFDAGTGRGSVRRIVAVPYGARAAAKALYEEAVALHALRGGLSVRDHEAAAATLLGLPSDPSVGPEDATGLCLPAIAMAFGSLAFAVTLSGGSARFESMEVGEPASEAASSALGDWVRARARG